jgi:hypothetical protein
MVTYRMWVPNRKGRVALHLSDSEIKSISVVHVAISEATPLGSASLLGPGGRWTQSFRANFGAASITVQNVSVRDGGVDIYAFVDWTSPLNLYVDITILDPPAAIVIGT